MSTVTTTGAALPREAKRRATRSVPYVDRRQRRVYSLARRPVSLSTRPVIGHRVYEVRTGPLTHSSLAMMTICFSTRSSKMRSGLHRGTLILLAPCKSADVRSWDSHVACGYSSPFFLLLSCSVSLSLFSSSFTLRKAITAPKRIVSVVLACAQLSLGISITIVHQNTLGILTLVRLLLDSASSTRRIATVWRS